MSKKINWELLPELIRAGNNFVQIAHILGCDNSTVSRKVKDLGLEGNIKICKANDSELIKKVDALHAEGKTNSEIAKILNICATTARRYTTLLGKQTNSVKAKSIKKVNLSPEQEEIIFGCMLGDMSICKTKKLARIVISQGGVHESYFDHLCNTFKGLLGKINKDPRFDKRTNKWYNKYVVKFLAHEDYLSLYQYFYPNGRKEITQKWIDKLTPRSIAY